MKTQALFDDQEGVLAAVDSEIASAASLILAGLPDPSTLCKMFDDTPQAKRSSFSSHLISVSSNSKLAGIPTSFLLSKSLHLRRMNPSSPASPPRSLSHSLPPSATKINARPPRGVFA